jgi:hypothetical protein
MSPLGLSRGMPYIEYDEVGAVCADCGMTFRTDEALSTHRAQVHTSGDRDVASAPSRPAPLRCGSCQQLFSSPSAFQDHNRIVHWR